MSYTDTGTTNEPKPKDGLWLVLGIVSLIALWFVSFAGPTGVKVFFGIALLVVFILMIATSGSVFVAGARVIATAASIGLFILMIVTHAPLGVAELMSPIGQALQDNHGDLGINILMGWLGIVVLAWAFFLFLTIRFWTSRSVPRILLSIIFAGLVLFPFVGMITQEIARQG